jgi:protein kinase X
MILLHIQAAEGEEGAASTGAGGAVKLGKKLADMELLTTLGTGTFGRVRLVKVKPEENYYALKMLKKSEIIRLKQVDHIKNEVELLSKISHPFIVNL